MLGQRPRLLPAAPAPAPTPHHLCWLTWATVTVQGSGRLPGVLPSTPVNGPTRPVKCAGHARQSAIIRSPAVLTASALAPTAFNPQWIYLASTRPASRSWTASMNWSAFCCSLVRLRQSLRLLPVLPRDLVLSEMTSMTTRRCLRLRLLLAAVVVNLQRSIRPCLLWVAVVAAVGLATAVTVLPGSHVEAAITESLTTSR